MRADVQGLLCWCLSQKMISQGFSPHLSNSTPFFSLTRKSILSLHLWGSALFYSLLAGGPCFIHYSFSGIFILYLSIASLFLPKNWMTFFYSKGTFLYPVSLHLSFAFTGEFLDRIVCLIYFSLKLSGLASVSSALLKLLFHKSQMTFRVILLDSQHFHHHSKNSSFLTAFSLFLFNSLQSHLLSSIILLPLCCMKTL